MNLSYTSGDYFSCWKPFPKKWFGINDFKKYAWAIVSNNIKETTLHLDLPSSRPLAHKALIRRCIIVSVLLAFGLGSMMFIRVVLFLFPLFSSTWSSVFRLYVFVLVSMWELWHSDYCDPFLARVWSNSTFCRTTSLHLCVCPRFSNSSLEMIYGQCTW